MHLTELNTDERRILLWLLATLSDVDGDLDPGELEQLQYVGATLEIELLPALREALEHYSDTDEALQAARESVRIAARDTIREVLEELVRVDGVHMPEERELLDAIEHAWR